MEAFSTPSRSALEWCVHNPFVPETLEGWSALHLMYRIDWGRLGQAYPGERQQMAEEFAGVFAGTVASATEGGNALVQMLGHKGDLMAIAFRRSFDELGRTQLALSRCKLQAYLTLTTSYVSIVELGMYDMTAKIHRQLAEGGLTHGSDAFVTAFDEEMDRQRQRVTGRLFGEIPHRRYVCFYPMDKRRGETHNWYAVEFERRAEMMVEHGKVGREYAGRVTQVISGSIGFDDWEWGVDLFADDPVTFKKLIYEMRFDEASAKYAEFGPFYTGLQFAPAELRKLLEGELPSLT
ncbi:MAG: heme-dependent peroxidase [Acidobacteria bacterium]|nr:heme-dependent peroxidase [Acidobacteriota bacterium]